MKVMSTAGRLSLSSQVNESLYFLGFPDLHVNISAVGMAFFLLTSIDYASSWVYRISQSLLLSPTLLFLF